MSEGPIKAETLPGLEVPFFVLKCGCAYCGRELAEERYELGNPADEREAYAFAQVTLTAHARVCEAAPRADGTPSTP